MERISESRDKMVKPWYKRPLNIMVLLFGYIALIILIYSVYSTSDRIPGLFGKPLNSNPPDYLKQLTVYKEGDGLIIYFILADQNGQMTTCDGSASIEIRAIPTGWDEIEDALDRYATSMGAHPKYLSAYGRKQALEKAEKTVLNRDYPIKKENFIKTKIGQGPFEQDAILCSFGRIPYSSMSHIAKNQKGKVKLKLLGPGKLFEAEETFNF